MDQSSVAFRVHRVEETTSTNDEAASAKYGHGSIVLARTQTAGRGQRGNRWYVEPGANATFSAVVCPTHRKANEQFAVSMGAALAVCDAAAAWGVEAQVKWPNDVYVGDRKLCGILIEHSSMGEYLARSVVGVGINVAQCEFPSAAGRPTSLHLEGAVGATVDGAVEAWAEAFEGYYAMPIDELVGRFRAKMRRGEGFWPYRDAATGEEFLAKVADLDGASGLLTLETKEKEKREYYFKEVEFIN